MLNVQTDWWDSLWLIISMSGDVFKCRNPDKWHLELPAGRPHDVLEGSAKKFKVSPVSRRSFWFQHQVSPWLLKNSWRSCDYFQKTNEIFPCTGWIWVISGGWGWHWGGFQGGFQVLDTWKLAQVPESERQKSVKSNPCLHFSTEQLWAEFEKLVKVIFDLFFSPFLSSKEARPI